jgi:RNA polymerase sigma factor (TIGR02999 family)
MPGPTPENPPPPEAITRLLRAWSEGDLGARDRLVPLVYDELRRRAAAYLRRERRGHTLQPTALVHEAYGRLASQHEPFQNRAQFFAMASQMMRRVLVDHARAHQARKRASGGLRVELTEGLAVAEPREVDMIALDRALEELAAFDERQARLVEMRFFGGLTAEEAADALAVSLATANRDWALARAWLFRRLKQAGSAAPAL